MLLPEVTPDWLGILKLLYNIPDFTVVIICANVILRALNITLRSSPRLSHL